MSARPEKIDLLSLLFDSAFDLELNIAPNLTPLRGTRTSKTSPGEDAWSFFCVRLRLSGAMFNSRSNALGDPMLKKCPFGTDTN
jgi:hypothetical protein